MVGEDPKIEHRAVIHFLAAHCASPKEIFERMSNVYINSEYYCGLMEELHRKKGAKRKGKCSKVVFQLHENAPLHNSYMVSNALEQAKFTVLDHPHTWPPATIIYFRI